MVEIRKGSLTLKVPKSSFEKKFSKVGWHLSSESKSDDTVQAEANTQPDTAKDLVADVDEPQDDEDEDVEYVDPEELEQKPLEELDKDELRILAEYKGIDISKLNTIKQLRTALRSLE